MKQSLQVIPLTPIFHMIQLYVKQYIGSFVNVIHNEFDKQILNQNMENGSNVTFVSSWKVHNQFYFLFLEEFNYFLINKMVRILSNASIKSLHDDSSKTIILILESLSMHSPVEFLDLVTEFIWALEGFTWLHFFNGQLNLLNHFNFKTWTSLTSYSTTRTIWIVKYCIDLQ